MSAEKGKLMFTSGRGRETKIKEHNMEKNNTPINLNTGTHGTLEKQLARHHEVSEKVGPLLKLLQMVFNPLKFERT